MKSERRSMWLALSATLVLSGPAFAAGLGTQSALPSEGTTVAPEPEAYGTTSESVLVIAGPNLNPHDSTVGWATAVSGSTGVSIYSTGSTSDWWTGVFVPSGAVITRLTIEACDSSAIGQLHFALASGVAPAGISTNVTPIGTTGLTETPGCGFFSVTPTSTLNVANGSNDYWAFVSWSGAGAFDGSVLLNSVRVFYRLQVSPAPATATFPTDVPTTHAFFRFVEALAAAGITGGCGTNQFCPDSPVTRGQMAVFLAVALGLHATP